MKTIDKKDYIFSQTDFDFFAELSGDYNPIHVDPEFAANSSFGKTVAHGIFLYSILFENLSSVIGEKQISATKIQFPAPTFTQEAMEFVIKETAIDEFELYLCEKETGVKTCVITANCHVQESDHNQTFKTQDNRQSNKLYLGQSFSLKRAFGKKDIAEYCEKFEPLQAYKNVPPPLLNAVISKILGIDLPGLGTNYLKQETQYLAKANIDEELEFEVKITKLRPEKKLVDLETICKNQMGEIIAIGRALVSARDVKGAF